MAVAHAMLVAAVRMMMEYNIQRQATLTANKRRRKRQTDTLENKVDTMIGTSAIAWTLFALRILAKDRHPICWPYP